MKLLSMCFSPTASRAVVFYFLFSLILCVAPAELVSSATAQAPIPLGVITKAGEIQVIAIPEFEFSEGAPGGEIAKMNDIIYRNLELSGYFKKPSNEKFVAEAHEDDKKAGKIEPERWHRLSVSFLLLGIITNKDGLLVTEVRLYGMEKGQRIFGSLYPPCTPQNLPRQARRISDDIIFKLTGNHGVANTQIVFVANRTKQAWSKDIWIMYADGTEQRPLTNDRITCASPCWGANGTEIYYTSYKDHNPDLCGLKADGSKSWYISRFPGLNISPAWSEARQRIALTLGKDGNSEVYTMDRYGRYPMRLTINIAIDSSPCWSPTGNRIAFTSDREGGKAQLYAMDADGLNTTRLTRLGAGYNYNDGAAWSPKSDLIAFSCRFEGKFDICTINIDGSGARQLTTVGNNEDPCWSPDGTSIVFTSDRRGVAQLFVMQADGSNQTQLTVEGINHSAAWGPFEK
ncbi:MAG: hypothetical protein NTX50_15450 [Candidatus Sumerlaeota bacterium]|nr:hypothetical protein [Candidatus Sumerlaeota bacterium]